MPRRRQDNPKRPYQPISLKVEVAQQQIRAIGHSVPGIGTLKKAEYLNLLLLTLGLDPSRAQLDHDPALGRRKINRARTDWIPAANDPRFLVWLDKDPHLEKTAGRGGEKMRFGGDTRAIAKLRRMEREPKKWKLPQRKTIRRKDRAGKTPFRFVTNKSAGNRKWPETKIPSRPFPRGPRPFRGAGRSE